MKFAKGFTLIELMVAIAIVGLMTMIAIPSMSDWIVRMRIDNEISSLHRLVNNARNSAINLEQPVTLCPLKDNSCTNDWEGELTVFLDLDNDGNLDNAVSVDIDNDGIADGPFEETVLRVKAGLTGDDELTFARDRVVYQPTGQASISNATFEYCVPGHSDKNRGITISLRGRIYQSKDYDGDGKEENRSGDAIDCS